MVYYYLFGVLFSGFLQIEWARLKIIKLVDRKWGLGGDVGLNRNVVQSRLPTNHSWIFSMGLMGAPAAPGWDFQRQIIFVLQTKVQFYDELRLLFRTGECKVLFFSWIDLKGRRRFDAKTNIFLKLFVSITWVAVVCASWSGATREAEKEGFLLGESPRSRFFSLLYVTPVRPYYYSRACCPRPFRQSLLICSSSFTFHWQL